MDSYDLIVLKLNDKEMMITHKTKPLMESVLGNKESMDYVRILTKAMTEVYTSGDSPMKDVVVRGFSGIPCMLSKKVMYKWYDISMNMSGMFHEMIHKFTKDYYADDIPFKGFSAIYRDTMFPSPMDRITDTIISGYNGKTGDITCMPRLDGANDLDKVGMYTPMVEPIGCAEFSTYTNSSSSTYSEYASDVSYVIVNYKDDNKYVFIEGNTLSAYTLKLLNNAEFVKAFFPNVGVRMIQMNSSTFNHEEVQSVLTAFNNVDQVVHYLNDRYGTHGIHRLYRIVESMIDRTNDSTHTDKGIDDVYKIFLSIANLKHSDKLRSQLVFLLDVLNVEHEATGITMTYKHIKNHMTTDMTDFVKHSMDDIMPVPISMKY
jgi:hypothetical protein